MGALLPKVRCWHAPSGAQLTREEVEITAEDGDGRWLVEVPLLDEAMMRLDVAVEAL